MSVSSPSSAAASQPPKLLLPASCEPPTELNPPKQAVWIIFGATGHIGRSLVRTALCHGDKVVAVGRTFENSMEQMKGWHENCLGLLCDVRVRETVEDVIQRAIRHWGRIDIIANCTGYGIVAAAEDQSQHDLLNQFETNFLGTMHIIQLSLSYFRTHSIPGRYLIFSSTAGALGVPGLAPYCATKYAVEGLIESMLYETHTFNIKATLVEPGYVRLDDNDNTIGPSPPTPRDRLKRYGHFVIKPNPSAAYAGATSPAGHAKRTFQWLDARQPTSAVRSAELVWQLGHCSYPPLRLLLGSYAVESIRDRLRCIIEEIEDWKHLSFHDAAEGDGDGEADGEADGEGEGEEDVEGQNQESAGN